MSEEKKHSQEGLAPDEGCANESTQIEIDGEEGSTGAAKPEEASTGAENGGAGSGDGQTEEAAPEADGQAAGEEDAEAGDAEAGDAEAEEAAGEEEAAEDSGDGKLSFRGRKQVKKLTEELQAMKDRHLRTLAEYENFRKRTEREKSDIYAFAVRDAMEKLLPVLDNLERGVAAIPEDAGDDPIAEGMKQICKQFAKALEDVGVKPMDAEGKPFDPNYHQAVMHVEDPKLDKNVVAAELLKGYTYRDTVVRHAMVSVAN